MGFADFFVPKMGLHIRDCSLHQKDGRKWISFPSKKYVNDDGEEKYRAYLRFEERSIEDQFRKEAIEAIERYCMKESAPF